ncbi:MAG: phosphoserine phosphatase SerB [Rhizobiaceae bacterium]
MPLVATLIANPTNPCLTREMAAEIAASLGTDAIDWLAPDIACDLHLPDTADAREAERNARRLLGETPVDLVVQPEEGRCKRLLIADMDSTMIDQECIDELADAMGIKERVAAITAQAMNGEIAFEPALRQRVALLRDLPVTTIDDVIKTRITLAAGGRQLVATMKRHGAHAALVSGGFTAFTARIAAMLGFDDHKANTLLEQDGRLTGEVAEPILGRDAKVAALLDHCARLGVEPADAIAVGDGANDLDMLAHAGSGVALHAKPVVAAAARFRVDHGDLTALLFMQGYRLEQFVQ